MIAINKTKQKKQKRKITSEIIKLKMNRLTSIEEDDNEYDFDNDDGNEDDDDIESNNYGKRKNKSSSTWDDFNFYSCPLYLFYCCYNQAEVSAWFQMRNAALLLDEIKTARRQLIREITNKEEEYGPEIVSFNNKIENFRSKVKDKIIHTDISSFIRSLTGSELRTFNHIRRQEAKLENLGTAINVYKEINEKLLENETSLDTIHREYTSYQKLRDKQALFKYINKIDISSVIAKTKKNMIKINQMMNEKSTISKYNDYSRITKQVIFGQNYNSTPSSSIINKFVIQPKIPRSPSIHDLPTAQNEQIPNNNKNRIKQADF